MSGVSIVVSLLGSDDQLDEGGHPVLDRVVGTIGLSQQGLDFGGPDGRKVDLIFLLLGPLIIDGRRIQPGEQHLFYGWHALAPVINTQNVMDRVRACLTREEVFDLIVAADRKTPEPGGPALDDRHE
jgi:mannitol/fructose-specific phosphotransferase system IIA component (Ntr-type)